MRKQKNSRLPNHIFYLHRTLELSQIPFIFGQEFLASVDDFVGFHCERRLDAVELSGIGGDELNVFQESVARSVLLILDLLLDVLWI